MYTRAGHRQILCSEERKTASITALIGGLQMFDVPQVLTNGAGTPNRSSTTLIMYLNNFLKTSKNYGMAGAVSVIIFIITGLLSILVFKSLTKDDN